ncbi:MAG: M1 family metallopeptidase [Chitinophagaceae bacterium]
MIKLIRLAAIPFMLFCFGLNVNGQQPGYDPHEAFAPFFYPNYGDKVRAADGTPGLDYWQNKADYKIDATLDDSSHSITGTVEISYINNSPQPLSFVWLQLDQDIYKSTSRGTLSNADERFKADKGFDGGYVISSVNIIQDGKAQVTAYEKFDTRMKISLSKPLKANGGIIRFKMSYRFMIPRHGTDRMGRIKSRKGWIYEIAQWFPRMCVYDNVQGWNVLPYIGTGEFYLEYGDISYNITAPKGYIVAGSGELLNATEVLTAQQFRRWNEARQSEQTVMLRTEAEVNSESQVANGSAKQTWKFKCSNTRDVAWAASKAFIWDAAKINLPAGKTSVAMSVYPIESSKDSAWKRSTQFVKGAIEFYSTYLYPYTYPSSCNVAGVVTGMEYPGIVFCGMKETGRSLWEVTSHEFGHNWFPMIVGSNERKFPWMDEGFNTFINGQADKDFNKGEYYQTKDPQLPLYLYHDSLETIMTIPDVQKNLGIKAYLKPGEGLNLLRDVVLGPDRFDKAFRYYVHQWAFKHPTPFDFFHCIENAAGESLDWFWRGWFFNSWKIDLAVTEVTDAGDGSLVTIACLGKMPMPFTIELTDKEGGKSRMNLPVERWQHGDTWKFKTGNKLSKVVVDPDALLPDNNTSNNTWTEK